MKIIVTMVFSFSGMLLLAQDVQQKDSTVLLQEFVISANKIPEMKSRVAQQIHVVSSAQIKDLNAQTTADLIGNSGMVSVQKSQQGGGSPQLRGFEASRIVLMIDGVRMNNLIFRAGHLQNIITLDNNSLERVEILFGPSSTMYGSDALGGVIHFKTKDVQLSTTGSASVSGNSFIRYASVNSEKTAHADVNVGLKKFGSFTSVTFSDFDDLQMGKNKNRAYGEEFGVRNFYVVRSPDSSQDLLIPNENPYVQKFSGYSQVDLIQKFLLKPGEATAHSLNLQLSSSSNIPRYDRLTDRNGAGLRSAEWYYGPQKRLLSSYQLTINKPSLIADLMDATLSFQNITESRHDRRFNATNRRNQIEKVNVFGFTVDLSKSIQRHSIRYGIDLQLNELKSTAYNEDVITGGRSPVETRYPDGKNKMNVFALYVTHTHEVGERLTLNDGIRVGYSALHSTFIDKSFFPFPFDEVHQRNTYASGNVGLIYRPDDWKLSFMASTGYRVPNVDDLAKVFDTNAGESLIVPNPNVKPEKTLNIDLSATKYFGDKIRLENTWYYTMFIDAIILDAFTFNGQSVVTYQGAPTRVLANQNKRQAYITGLSSTLHAEISESITAQASIVFTRGRIKTDSTFAPLDHIPPTLGRISLSYQKKRFRAETFANFNGWKRIDDYLLNSEDNEAYATEKGTPSWHTLNFRFSYFAGKRFTLQVGIDNLFDLQYRVFASGINAPGRNISGTLRYNF